MRDRSMRHGQRERDWHEGDWQEQGRHDRGRGAHDRPARDMGGDDRWTGDRRGGGPVGFGLYPAPYWAPGAMMDPTLGTSRGREWQQRDDMRGRGRHDDDRGFFDRAADEVASWFGDDEAQARRQQDHGGRGPRGYRRSDERIAEDVNERLTEDPMLDATEVRVSVHDAEVTLDGSVDSRGAKRRAEDCADAVSGVGHVQNNLRVTGQDGRAGGRGGLEPGAAPAAGL